MLLLCIRPISSVFNLQKAHLPNPSSKGVQGSVFLFQKKPCFAKTFPLMFPLCSVQLAALNLRGRVSVKAVLGTNLLARGVVRALVAPGSSFEHKNSLRARFCEYSQMQLHCTIIVTPAKLLGVQLKIFVFNVLTFRKLIVEQKVSACFCARKCFGINFSHSMRRLYLSISLIYLFCCKKIKHLR